MGWFECRGVSFGLTTLGGAVRVSSTLGLGVSRPRCEGVCPSLVDCEEAVGFARSLADEIVWVVGTGRGPCAGNGLVPCPLGTWRETGLALAGSGLATET